MTQYIPFDEKVEVIGQSVLSFVNVIPSFEKVMLSTLAKHGITDIQPNKWYPKKNWSSLMLFNCSHPSIKNLNINNINTKQPAWLHRMEWCKENEIGEIDKKYNYLVGYYNDNNFKALHYTDGGPWYENFKNCEFNKR